MTWWGRLLRRTRVESELDREIRDHVDRLVSNYVRDGMNEAEARRRAILDFGGLDQMKELCRDARGTRLVEDFSQDTRYAVRMLVKQPGFAIVAILTLALGIGANTAVFSMVDAVVLRPLPVRNPQELIQVGRLLEGYPSDYFSYPQVRLLADQTNLFSGLAGFGTETMSVGPIQSLEPARAAWVSGGYFETLGISPAAGRLLAPADDRPAAQPAAVITERYWAERFNRDPLITGKTILIEGTTAVPIVGVTPAGFVGAMVGEPADIMLAVGVRPQVQPEAAGSVTNDQRWLGILARPRSGLTPSQVSAQLAAVWPAILDQTTSTSLSPEVRRRRLSMTLTTRFGAAGLGDLRNQFRTPLFAAMALVVFVFLIACVNVANLLFARATSRRREIALRLAIGAGRARIVRQLLTESALLATAGAVVGIAISAFVSRGLALLLAGQAETGVNGIAVDTAMNWRLFCFATVTAMSSMMLFGLIPALRTAKVQPSDAMSEGSPRQSEHHGRAGAVLVSLQVALSLLLLVSAGLFGRTLWNLRSIDRGFSHQGALVVRIDHTRTGKKDAALLAFLDDVRQMALRQPGVRAASLSAVTPLQGGGISQQIAVNGTPTTEEVHYNNVDADYFDVMQTPVLRGRGFTPQDRTAANGVVLVNETFVRMYLPSVNPLGQQVQMSGGRIGGRRNLEIVGVVRDAVYETLRASAPPTIYAPFVHRGPNVTLTVLAPGAIAQVGAALRAELQPLLGGRLVRMQSMTAQVEGSIAEERLLAIVSAVFGALALVLAGIGVYGLLAYRVSRRTREIGIRVALGARGSAVMRLVMRDAAVMLAIGIALGVPAAFALSRFVSSLLFGLSPTDPGTMAAAIGVLAGAAMLAAWIPARRATRVDAMTALRAE